MIKIAFPTNDGITIFPHFGRAQQFKVVTLTENQPPTFEIRSNDDQCNHDHGADHDHHDHHHNNKFEVIKDCQLVMAGGMGQRAYDNLANMGIQVLLPNEKEIDAVLAAYQEGTLISNSQRVHAHHHH